MTSREDVSRLDHELLLALAAQVVDWAQARRTVNGPAHSKALERSAKVALRQIRAGERQEERRAA